MNKRLIIPLAFSLLMPLSSFAAFDTLSLGTSAVLSVGGRTINITSSTSTIASLTVTSSTFTADVETGSVMTFSSTDRKEFSVSSAPAGVSAAQTCTDSVSQVDISLPNTIALTSATVTVTPTDTTCTTTTTTTTTTTVTGGGGPAGSFGVSGGGGGGGVFIPSATSASPSTGSATTNTATPTVNTTATLTAQLDALTAQLSSLKSATTFSKDLRVGSKGDDVIALQTWLEAQGFLSMPVGVAKGYYGASTRAAVMKYQKSVGLPQVGVVGPATRATLNGGGSVSTAPTSMMASGSFTANLYPGSKGEAVTALQKFLEAKGFLVVPAGVAYGYYGPATKAAVLKYQQSEGVAGANGNFGPATRAKANAQ